MKIRRDVKGLIKALTYNKEVQVRKNAAIALGTMRDFKAVQPLILAIKDSSQSVSISAIEALGNIGNPEAVEALIKASITNNHEIQRSTKEALLKIRDIEAIKFLIENLDHTKHGAPKLSKDTKTENLTEYEIAKEALEKIGEPAIKPLIKALGDCRSDVSNSARDILINIGNPAIEPLIGAMKEKYTRAGVVAKEILEKIGEPAIKPLIKALGDCRSDVSNSARDILINIGNPAIEPLIGAIKEEYVGVRVRAAEILEKIGDAQALAVLYSTLSDNEKQVASASWRAICQISAHCQLEPEEPAIAFIINVFLTNSLENDPWRNSFYIDENILSDFKLIGKNAIPPLTKCLKNLNKTVRLNTIQLLGVLGENSTIVLDSLLEALSDPQPDVGRCAAEAIGKICTSAKTITPTLAKLIKSENEKMRENAIRTFLNLKQRDPSALPYLLDALFDPEFDVRYLAAKTIVKFGASQPTVGSLLIEACKKNPNLIYQIGGALFESPNTIIDPPEIIDLLITYLFQWTPLKKEEYTPARLKLKYYVQTTTLTTEIVDMIFDACGKVYDGRGYVVLEDRKKSDDAVKNLCERNSQVTSNILHLVAKKSDITLTLHSACSMEEENKISFQNQRDLAKKELEKRGNPPYDPKAYIKIVEYRRESVELS